jgi:DNA-binding PadR family transcriptional regulator
MDRIAGLSGGLVAVNPNTMYPLLRRLEADGMIRGEWEHPERRSRRFYAITEAGTRECAALREEVEPRLERIGRSIGAIRAELDAAR